MSTLSPSLEQKVRELRIRAYGLLDDADYRVKNDLLLEVYGAAEEYIGVQPREGSRLSSLLERAELQAKPHVEKEAIRNLRKFVPERHTRVHRRTYNPYSEMPTRIIRTLADSLFTLVFKYPPPRNAQANLPQANQPSESHDNARAFKQQWGWKSKDTWEIVASAPYDVQVQMDSGTLSFDAVLSELGNALLVHVEDRLIWLDPLTLDEQFERSFVGDKILDFAVEADASHSAVLVGPTLYLLNKEGETIWCRDAATGSEEVHDFPFDEEERGAVYLANGKIIPSLVGEEIVTNVFSLSGKILTRLKPEVGYALQSVTRDAKWIMFRYEESVELMDTHRKRPVFNYDSYPNAAEISADGSTLASIDIDDMDSGRQIRLFVLRFRRPWGELISEKLISDDSRFIDYWNIGPPLLTQDGAYCLILATPTTANEYRKSLIGLFDTATVELLWLNDVDRELGYVPSFSSSGLDRPEVEIGVKITPDARLIAVTKPDGFLLYNGEGVALWQSEDLGGSTSIVAITPGGQSI